MSTTLLTPPVRLLCGLLSLGWCNSLSDFPGCEPISAQVASEVGSTDAAPSSGGASESYATTSPGVTTEPVSETTGPSTATTTDESDAPWTDTTGASTGEELCGNGAVDPGEVCDPADPDAGTGCGVDCVPAEVRAVDIAGGDDHVCVLFNTNALRCFAADDPVQEIFAPALPSELYGPLTAVFAGGKTTCVTSEAMAMSLCWNLVADDNWRSYAYYGAIVINDESTTAPLWCGRDDLVDELYCWGETDPLFVQSCLAGGEDEAQKVLFMSGVRAVEAGKKHVCAIAVDGTVTCFGRNNGDDGIACGPIASSHCCGEACADDAEACDHCGACVANPLAAVALSAWGDVTCAVTEPPISQQQICWGPAASSAKADLGQCSTTEWAQIAVFGPGPRSCLAAAAGLELCCKGEDGTHHLVAGRPETTVQRIIGTSSGAYLLTTDGAVIRTNAPAWTLDTIELSN